MLASGEIDWHSTDRSREFPDRQGDEHSDHDDDHDDDEYDEENDHDPEELEGDGFDV